MADRMSDDRHALRVIEGLQDSIPPVRAVPGLEQSLAGERLRLAARRDEVAHARDLAAHARDLAAEARDRVVARIDADEVDDRGRPATRSRVMAAEQRMIAAQDRRQAARDREASARERLRALADRELLTRALAAAETDECTGVRPRLAGLLDLTHELDRCRQTHATLVVVYIDVVGPNVIDDSQGDVARDELLRRVVTLIRQHVRSYDLIIRLGGDAFACAMSGATLADARQCFRRVCAALDATLGPGAIRTGFAVLSRDDDVTDLIRRADSHLVDASHTPRRPCHPAPAPTP